MVVIVAAGTTWAVSQLGGLHRAPAPAATFDPNRTRQFDTPYGSSVPLPDGWFGRGIVGPGLELLDMTTNRGALGRVIQGCGSDNECSTRNFGEGDVGPKDAFVQVGVILDACSECSPAPIPSPLTPADFHPADSIDGEPVMELLQWIDDGTQLELRFWNGPDASATDREATEFLLRNLSLPSPEQLTPTTVTTFWGADVTVPGGWAVEAASTPFEGFRAATSPAAMPMNGNYGPTDAWISVNVPTLREPCQVVGGCQPAPGAISLDDLHLLVDKRGAPILEGFWAWENTTISVDVWIGPKASSRTREEALSLLASIHLATERFSNPDRHFTIDVPSTWIPARVSLTPELSSPIEIFAAGTFVPLRQGSHSCANWPVNALEELGPTDAFVWIAEAAPVGDFPPRPASFADEQPDPRMEARFCLRNPDKPFTQWWIPFTQGNRNFYLYVAMGNDVSDARRTETWKLVDSFAPEPAPSISPQPKPRPTGASGTTSSSGG